MTFGQRVARIEGGGDMPYWNVDDTVLDNYAESMAYHTLKAAMFCFEGRPQEHIDAANMKAARWKHRYEQYAVAKAAYDDSLQGKVAQLMAERIGQDFENYILYGTFKDEELDKSQN